MVSILDPAEYARRERNGNIASGVLVAAILVCHMLGVPYVLEGAAVLIVIACLVQALQAHRRMQSSTLTFTDTKHYTDGHGRRDVQ